MENSQFETVFIIRTKIHSFNYYLSFPYNHSSVLKLYHIKIEGLMDNATAFKNEGEALSLLKEAERVLEQNLDIISFKKLK